MKLPGSLGEILNQAQKIQQNFGQLQEGLEQERIEGSAGAGLVKVVISGTLQVLSVEVDPSLIKVDERSMLQDLIQAATNDALRKVKELLKERFGQLTGGIPLPGFSF